MAMVGEATVAGAADAGAADAEEPQSSSPEFRIRKSMSYRLKANSLRADCLEALFEMGFIATGQQIIDFVVAYGVLPPMSPPLTPPPPPLPWMYLDILGVWSLFVMWQAKVIV